MARLSKEQLCLKVIDAIRQSGWLALSVTDENMHPFELRAVRDGRSIDLKVYIWNLTHGGGAARPADEYRIQVTGVSSFATALTGVTLILGWWDEAGVFAAFDLARHQGDLGFSPSIQIREPTLRGAYEHGVDTHVKGNGEIAVAFRPDFLMYYVENLRELHAFGQSERDAEMLSAAMANPDAIGDQEIASLTETRQSVIRQTIEVLRDWSFRRRVYAAYEHGCAVCRLQLGLVEAAHIVPVGAGGSDATSNGMALCPTHHEAFDAALISVADDYRVLVSESRLRKLQAHDLVGGADTFRATLLPYIFLPAELASRPNLANLRRGREIRQWAG